MTQLTAQQRANKKQESTRADQPRYMLRMTEQEGELLNRLAIKYGTKKAAIMEGLKLVSK